MQNFPVKLKLMLTLVLFLASPFNSLFAQMKTATSGGYTYQYVENDPLNARIYTLQNGLTVYLSQNQKEPRIQTQIAVRAGSAYDPADATGLAHYLEHMLFKGTQRMGTINWEKEKVELQKISDLYEKLRVTVDEPQRRAIYRQIDSISYIASGYAVPNEYDKMISSLGAKGTNAYTANDRTVYVNDIPTNELEKWLMVEAERMSNLVLRLFHTELETVYEEFNMSQDNDIRKIYFTMFRDLFDGHPYGSQTTIGEGEHLKNPSMVKIHEYFDKYYVPSNMAVCLSGDLDFDATIALIDKYMGKWENRPAPSHDAPKAHPINEPVTNEVFGPDAERVMFGYRFNGANSDDILYMELINGILFNGQAGLVDLNLLQQQSVQSAFSFVYPLKDYSSHIFGAQAREGQTMEEAQNLLLAEIEKVKRGEFDQWLIEAVINNMQLDQIRKSENNNARTAAFVEAYTNFISWDKHVSKIDRMRKITKEELVKFANEHYKNNYITVFKRRGQDPNVLVLEKPEITPIQMNRDAQSEFYTEFASLPSENLSPLFLDFSKDIDSRKLKSGIKMDYIKNSQNELFYLYYIFDMGSENDRKMALAFQYLPYLGTNKYTAAQLKQEFFKMGITMNASASNDQMYVYISGLESSKEEGIKLLEHILANVVADEAAYNEMVNGIIRSRSDAKLNKNNILWNAMINFGIFGENSPFRNFIPEEELRQIKPQELVDRIRQVTSYKHKVFYYGPETPASTARLLDKHHKVPKKLNDYPEAVKFAERNSGGNKVYFVNYDMVQVDFLMLGKDEPMNVSRFGKGRLFNEYFGGGLSSIVFQEIRESKALAYSAFSSYSTPANPDRSHWVYAYIGTQADKLNEAVPAMLELLNEMPKANKQFNSAREAVMRKIESERITGTSIYWSYEAARKRGLNHDIRKDIYDQMQVIGMEDLSAFFNSHIKGKEYTYLLLGKREMVDMEYLKKLGEVVELSLEDLFGY